MNFLGHLYFSNNELPLMVANLYGDFVKGTQFEHLPPIVKAGILLHREIDDFVDHHPQVKILMHQLYEELPKVTGIAIDLFFDHLLAKHWEAYHPSSLNSYLDRFFEYALKPEHLSFESPISFSYTNRFQVLLQRISTGKWIQNYTNIEGLSFAARGLSQRISFPNALGQAPNVFLKHEKEITETFTVYMEEAIQKFL